MPELPEVEVVRAGLERGVLGRTIDEVSAAQDRTIRRHKGDVVDFIARLRGQKVETVERRGKYLWMGLSSGEALVAHLGMSGQLLLLDRGSEPTGDPQDLPKHLRASLTFAGEGPILRFVDQRTFGGLAVESLGPGRSGRIVPTSVNHIAPDPLEAAFDRSSVTKALKKRTTGIKRALLDQNLISGIGNIYADEALWRARIHFDRTSGSLTRPEFTRLFAAIDDVLREALVAGGTTFDGLYVAVNGASGYFDRDLAVYGREGLPCPRCGGPIRRTAFMNRSSHFCPHCQV